MKSVFILSIVFAGLAAIFFRILQSGLLRRKSSSQRSVPISDYSTPQPASLIVSRHYVTGHRRPETVQPGISEQFEKEGAIFAPGRVAEPAIQGWNTLVVQPPIGEDGELSEPEAPTGARPPRPALPAKAELRDAEVYAMRRFMRCSGSWTSGSAPLRATLRPRSGRPLPTSTSGPLPERKRETT